MQLFRLLLHLYPTSFRHEYGVEMTAAFADRMRDAAGPLARAALVAGTVPDTLYNAALVHADILRQDLRYASRTLNRARGFALTAIALIAVGIGANTAAFSVTDFVLLKPLPFPHAERLATVLQRQPGYQMELAPINWDDWRRGAASFEASGAYTIAPATLTGTDEPARVTGARVTADLLDTLQVAPALGRLFHAGEDRQGAAGVLVISDGLWRAAFGGAPDVIGRTIRLDDEPYAIVGVMPPGFAFPSIDEQFWRPLRPTPRDYDDRTNNFLFGLARLKPGVTVAAAQAEMSARAADTRRQFPKEVENTDALVLDFRNELARDSRLAMLALNGAALCMLLIVCANLANLLIARALTRRHEVAVRTALGAGRERLVRQLATESLVLAVIGGTGGVLLAKTLIPILWTMVSADLPTAALPGLDPRVLGFAAMLTIASAFLFGLAPILRAGGDVSAWGLREGARATGGRRERLRSALVAAEVVASVVLLIVTGLLIRALWTVQQRDPGFRTEGVLTLQTILPAAKYGETERRAEFYRGVLDRVRALPGVQGAAYISGMPIVWGGGIWPVGITGVELERRKDNSASMRFTTPGFFAALSIPIRRGRDVSDSDTMKTQMVAVVSESLVERYWPGEDGIGRQFNFAGSRRTIVGVVGDVRVRGLERTSEPQVYLSHRQVADATFWGYTPKALVVRASSPLDPLVPAIRRIIAAADPQLPIFGVRPAATIVEGATASRQTQVKVLAVFAGVAVLLAGIGLHGVLAFAVSQRTAEIGVRVALGATQRDVVLMVARQAARMVGAGIAAGVVLAYVAGRSVQTVLAGVRPSDGLTYAVVAGLTVTMALAGTILPALRALRVDPIRAIRSD